MVKPLIFITTGALIGVLICTPVMAGGGSAENDIQPSEATQIQQESRVPKAQLELMKKREEALLRKEEMLKVREETIKALDKEKEQRK